MPCAKQYVYFSLTDNQIKISLEKQYIKQNNHSASAKNISLKLQCICRDACYMEKPFLNTQLYNLHLKIFHLPPLFRCFFPISCSCFLYLSYKRLVLINYF